MTDRTDPGELAALVGSLTSAAQAAPPPGTEAACAAVAGIDRPGAAPVLAHGGVTAAFDADGDALPADSPEVTPVREDTLFDLASVTKVVTALTAATMIEDGLLDPEAPVAEHLEAPHPAITARHLLTHTSGLPPVMPLWRIEGSREDRLAAIRRAELDAAPGTAHAYSCIGFILLGTLLEHLGGAPLPELARRRVLDPVGARGAGWDPDPSAAAGAAATEHQTDPPRGLVRGSTHDRTTAWSLGGVGNGGRACTRPRLTSWRSAGHSSAGLPARSSPRASSRCWARTSSRPGPARARPGGRASGCASAKSSRPAVCSPASWAIRGSPAPRCSPIPSPGPSRRC